MAEPILGLFKDALEEATSLEELESLLKQWLDFGNITQEQAANLYDTYSATIMENPYGAYGLSGEQKEYISSFTSEKDLVDRLSRFNIPPEEATAIRDFELGQPDLEIAMGLRESRGRFQQEQEELQLKEEEAQRGEAQGKLQQGVQLVPLMNYINKSPYITDKDRGIYKELPTDQQIQSLYSLARQRELKAQETGRGEEQTGLAILGGLQRKSIEAAQGRRRPGTPEIPRALPIIEEYLKGTGLAEGSRLRNLIESQMGDLVSGVRGARERWWRKLHKPEEEEDTFKSESRRLRGEASKWGGLIGIEPGMSAYQRAYALQTPGLGSAPTATTAGTTYFGAGGLAGIAQSFYERAQRNLAGLDPADFRGARRFPKPAERPDPLIGALGKKSLKDYMADLYRKTPAQRGFSPRRFAPAVRF